MTPKTNRISIQTIARELLDLSRAKRGLLVEQYDILRDEWRYRWFADGRTVRFTLDRSDLNGSLNAIATLRASVDVWRASEAGDVSDGEYERLKTGATAANLSWAEDRLTAEEAEAALGAPAAG